MLHITYFHIHNTNLILSENFRSHIKKISNKQIDSNILLSRKCHLLKLLIIHTSLFIFVLVFSRLDSN